MRKILVVLISIPVALFVILEIYFSLNYFTFRRTPDKFMIPNQYQGWVVVELENPDCPALSVRDGYSLFEIDAEGRFCTSSKRSTGWAESWYTYQSQPEINLMQNPVTGMNRIWNEYHTEKMIGNERHRFYYFYVGLREWKE